MTEIVNINVNNIYPHPDNPRKDLGDLTELIDSVRKSGIMQNLTIIKGHTISDTEYQELSAEYKKNPTESLRMVINRKETDNGYTVIIGHRRLAAAKAAGLKTVPCVITEMPYKEQVATMLMENMQRADLTIYEQAQGFQMMIDFGDTIDGISEKTGFSKASVRRRLKMAELNQNTLKDVSQRQFNLYDMDKVFQIEDENTKNLVAAEIGTKNFENALSKAMEAQKEKKKKDEWKKIFESKGMTEIDYSDVWSGNYSCPEKIPYLSGEPDEKLLDDNMESGIQYYYAWGYNGTPYIRMDKIENEETTKTIEDKQRKEAEERERHSKLSEIAERAFKLRFNFIHNFTFTDSKKHLKEINEWTHIREIVGFISESWFTGCSTVTGSRKNYFELFGLTKEVNEEKVTYSMIAEFVQKHPEKALLYHAYAIWCDSKDETCFDWGYHFKENKKLKMIYQGLCALGYELSDEEEEMLNGSCPLFEKDDDSPIDCDTADDDDDDSEIGDDDFDMTLAEKLIELTNELDNQ